MKNRLKTAKFRRTTRVRRKIRQVINSPRLSVYRSNKGIYAQIIDDGTGKTLVSVSEKEIKKEGEKKLTRIEKAGMAGKLLAEKALKKKIKKVVFDRGSYRYHGRVKALAEGSRAGGLIF